RLLRGLGLVPVALAQLRRAVEDLTLLARLHVVPGRIDDARLDEEGRATGGAGMVRVLLRPQDRAQGAHLRLPERVVEPHPRQRLLQSREDGPGHDRGAVVALCEAREVALREFRVV